MKIYDFSISSRKCHVIYTGCQYVFICDGCGVFAIADREEEDASGKRFTLSVGNDYAPAGDDAVIRRCKAFITSEETRLINCAVAYDVKFSKLHNFGVSVKTYENK